MRCPVHNVEGCECAYAVRWREAMLQTGEAPKVESVALDDKKSPGRCSPSKLLALSFAGAVLACGPRPATCSERDAALIAREAECLARVKDECAGVPLDQPCAFEDACNAFVRERCK